MKTEESLSRLILELIAQCDNTRISTRPSMGPGEHHALNNAGFELKPASQSNGSKKDKSYEKHLG